MTPPQSANADSSPYAGEPFGKWYAVGSSTAQKPPFGTKGRWRGAAAPEGLIKGAHEARALCAKQRGVSPMSKGGPLVRFAHDAGRPLRIEEAHEGRRRTCRRGRLMREKALPFSLFF